VEVRALVVEDDPVFRDLVCDILRKQGLSPIEAADGRQALDLFFGRNDVDLMILDVMIPVCDGWEVLKIVREHSDVPVVMLTALGDERHEVLGLRKGADDYIAKPFSYEVFVARLNAHVRRIRKERQADLLAGEIAVSQTTHAVTVAGSAVELSRKEYGLLVYFATNRNRVLTREQILANVWGYDFDGDERTVDTHVKTLRAKLSGCGDYIRTVRGTGYLFAVNQP
jgi:two-component system, OmpR family, response regulator ResD